MKFVFSFIALGLFVIAYPLGAIAQNWNGQNGYQAPNNQYQQQSQNQYQNQYGNQGQSQYSNQAQNQYGQSQYGNQMQGQYGGSQQNNQMYYGQANQNQPGSNMSSTGSGYTQPSNQAGNSQGTYGGQSSPGSYLEGTNQAGSLSGGAQRSDRGRSKASILKGAAGGIGSMLGKSIKVAAPVAGTVAGNYMMNKAAQRTGYYQPNPYGTPYGVNPYGMGNPYGYGTGYGTGYGNPYGAVNPYGYGGGGGYYPPQQTMGNSILNTGLRALFGNGY